MLSKHSREKSRGDGAILRSFMMGKLRRACVAAKNGELSSVSTFKREELHASDMDELVEKTTCCRHQRKSARNFVMPQKIVIYYLYIFIHANNKRTGTDVRFLLLRIHAKLCQF